MALLDELASVLSTVASSSGTFLLFRGMMPDSTALPDKVVALIEVPGGPGLAGQSDLTEPHVQMMVRGDPTRTTSTTYEETKAKAVEATDILHGVTPGSLGGGNHYVGIWALQEPFLLEFDASDRPILVNNFRLLRSRA